MLNTTFAYQNMGMESKFRIYPPCTIFTPQLCYNFATYLPRENLCRFIFSSGGGFCICRRDMFKNVENPCHVMRKTFL